MTTPHMHNYESSSILIWKIAMSTSCLGCTFYYQHIIHGQVTFAMPACGFVGDYVWDKSVLNI